MTDERVELKVCPFCGGPATAWDCDSQGNSPSVWCQNSVSCGAEVSLHEPGQDAIATWNTRSEGGLREALDDEARNKARYRVMRAFQLHDEGDVSLIFNRTWEEARATLSPKQDQSK